MWLHKLNSVIMLFDQVAALMAIKFAEHETNGLLSICASVLMRALFSMALAPEHACRWGSNCCHPHTSAHIP